MPVSKVVYGNNILIDLTQDTVSDDYLILGITAHRSDGESLIGTYNPYLTRRDALLIHGAPTFFTDSYEGSRPISYKTVTYQNGDMATFVNNLGDNDYYLLYESYDKDTNTITKTFYHSSTYNFLTEIGLNQPVLADLAEYKEGERVVKYVKFTPDATEVTVTHNGRKYMYTVTTSNQDGVDVTTVESKWPTSS